LSAITKLGEFPLIAGILTDRDFLSVDSDMMNAVDIIELRIDMFGLTEPGHVKDVFKEVRSRYNKPIIATVRDVREAEKKRFLTVSISTAVLSRWRT